MKNIQYYATGEAFKTVNYLGRDISVPIWTRYLAFGMFGELYAFSEKPRIPGNSSDYYFYGNFEELHYKCHIDLDEWRRSLRLVIGSECIKPSIINRLKHRDLIKEEDTRIEYLVEEKDCEIRENLLDTISTENSMPKVKEILKELEKKYSGTQRASVSILGYDIEVPAHFLVGMLEDYLISTEKDDKE